PPRRRARRPPTPGSAGTKPATPSSRRRVAAAAMSRTGPRTTVTGEAPVRSRRHGLARNFSRSEESPLTFRTLRSPLPRFADHSGIAEIVQSWADEASGEGISRVVAVIEVVQPGVPKCNGD